MRLMSVCCGKRKSNPTGWLVPPHPTPLLPQSKESGRQNSRENQAAHNSSMRQLNARNEYGCD